MRTGGAAEGRVAKSERQSDGMAEGWSGRGRCVSGGTPSTASAGDGRETRAKRGRGLVFYPEIYSPPFRLRRENEND